MARSWFRENQTLVVIVAAAIAVVSCSIVYEKSTEAQPVKPTCVSDEDRVHIRAQVLGAVDDAFRDNMKHLFTTWLKDASRPAKPRLCRSAEFYCCLPARPRRCAQVVA